MPVALAIFTLVVSVMLVGLTLFFALATVVSYVSHNDELVAYDLMSTLFCLGMLWFIEGTVYDAFVCVFS